MHRGRVDVFESIQEDDRHLMSAAAALATESRQTVLHHLKS